MDPCLSSCIEQSSTGGVFTDGACEVVLSDAGGDLCPGRAVVAGLVQIGREVVPFVARGGDIGDGRVMGRRLDNADESILGQIRRSDVLPGFAVIARDVYEAVIGASPEEAGRDGRLGKGED